MCEGSDDVAKHGVTEFLNVFHDVGSTFFDIESDLLIVLDKTGNIERVNPAFERELGRTEAEVWGMPLIRLVRMDDWARFLRTFTAIHPEPVRLMKKGEGEIVVTLAGCRFRQGRGFLILRKT